jgi:hypothetical protein
LLSNKDLSTTALTNLVIERLYYADGRHHPEHPNHGSVKGLTTFT